MESNGKNTERVSAAGDEPHDTKGSNGGCPFTGRARSPRVSNRTWWPNSLDLSALRANSPKSDPMGRNFNYAEEFKSLDLDAVINDLRA